MHVHITALSENTATFGCLGEWGLCLLIETPGLTVLLDTGMTISAINNARVLHIDLGQVEAICLSHGHIDHVGGLLAMLKLSGAKKVVAHPDIWFPKFRGKVPEEENANGVPFPRKSVEAMGATLVHTKEPLELSPHVVLSGEVPMVTDFEEQELGRFRLAEGGMEPDSFIDELALAVKTPRGLVVATGCAHRGVINTIRHFQNITGEQRISAVVGGLHLFSASDERIERTIEALVEMDVKHVAVSHCTGFRATTKIAEAFGSSFVHHNAGVRLVLGEDD